MRTLKQIKQQYEKYERVYLAALLQAEEGDDSSFHIAILAKDREEAERIAASHNAMIDFLHDGDCNYALVRKALAPPPPVDKTVRATYKFTGHQVQVLAVHGKTATIRMVDGSIIQTLLTDLECTKNDPNLRQTFTDGFKKSASETSGGMTGGSEEINQ